MPPMLPHGVGQCTGDFSEHRSVDASHVTEQFHSMYSFYRTLWMPSQATVETRKKSPDNYEESKFPPPKRTISTMGLWPTIPMGGRRYGWAQGPHLFSKSTIVPYHFLPLSNIRATTTSTTISPATATMDSPSTLPTRNSISNMDEIIKLSIPLLRNERWRIRETIYYNRTAKKKKVRNSKELLSDGLMREHYAGLLKAFRSEVASQLRRNAFFSEGLLHQDADADGQSNEDDHYQTLEFNNSIRQNPEIMMRVYSYLPLRDRICQLSLVDRAFSKDAIRGGIVSATYGGGFNLKQALLELRQWAVAECDKRCRDAHSRMCNEVAILELQKKKHKEGILPKELYKEALQEALNETQELREQLAERRDKISRMLEEANLMNGELLLFTGSNLTNNIVRPSIRKRWIKSHVDEFLAHEREEWKFQQQQQHLYQSQSWLTEIVLVEKFLKRYFFDGGFNRLERLVETADFGQDWMEYKRCQKTSKNRVNEEGKLVWCLPNLDPGCNLWLLDPDVEGGWKEHRFVTCAGCSQLREIASSSSSGVSCEHGQYGQFCCDCLCRYGTYTRTLKICQRCRWYAEEEVNIIRG